MLTVACVLKSGGDYSPEYVNILRDSVRRHWPEGVPFRFACLTDLPASAFAEGIEVVPLAYPFPGWWAKMELFSPRVSDALGDILYFDLDTAICGPLDLAVRRPTRFTILRDFYRPKGYGSGVMFIPAGTHAPWEAFISGDEETASTWRAHANGDTGFRGDQDFLEKYAPGAALWQDVCPGVFVSFKPAPIFIAGKPALLASAPKGASVVCFHGFPRPAELPDGTAKFSYCDDNGHAFTPQAHWTRAYWRRDPIITSEDFHDTEEMAV